MLIKFKVSMKNSNDFYVSLNDNMPLSELIYVVLGSLKMGDGKPFSCVLDGNVYEWNSVILKIHLKDIVSQIGEEIEIRLKDNQVNLKVVNIAKAQGRSYPMVEGISDKAVYANFFKTNYWDVKFKYEKLIQENSCNY